MIYHTCVLVPGGSSGGWCPGGSLGVWYIMSNVTDWRASCVIILVIWNDSLVFVGGAGTGWPSSIIIGLWGVCVIVGVWSFYTVRSSSTTAGEVSACMGCRCWELLLGHCFSVCLIFLFLYVWEYHVSAAKPPIISAWFFSFTYLSTTADHIPVHQIIYLWNILPSRVRR